MLTTFKIQIIDTENGKYEYNGPEITREEYNRMVEDEYNRTKNGVQDLMYGRLDRNKGIYRANERVKQNDMTNYSYRDFEALIRLKNGNEIDDEYISTYIDNGKMFIVELNINPNSLYNDDFDDNFATEELRFWADDSIRVRNDYTLDGKTKILRLPSRDLTMLFNEKEYKLKNCKIVEDNSSKKYPYNYFILVEKITY